MRPIDADALIEKCGDWYVEEGTESGFIGTLKNLLATEPTIQPGKAQLSCEGTTKGTTSDTISRQWLLECVDEGWIKFDTEKDANRFIHLVRDIAPTAQPVVTDTNVGDTISRQAVLDEIKAVYEWHDTVTMERLIEHINNLPTIQPEPKEGEWIPVQRHEGDTQPDLECPFCKHRIGWFDMGRYCAGCGAKLKGGAG